MDQSGSLNGGGTHVLVVDDDQRIRTMLARFLVDHGLRVSQASNGVEMFQVSADARIDVIVLDIMMPGEDGLSLCRRMRAESPVPIILLTAMNAETDRIIGLEIGADDYVVKPFNPRELLARIRAVTRRMMANSTVPKGRGSATYTFEGWVLDANRRTLISPDGALTDLTSGEFDLLTVFLEHPQRVLNRDQLLDLAHGRSSQAYDRSIDVQISRLRRKIEANPQAPVLIKTVRNEGYFFTATVTDLPKAGG
ncbi:response regulator [Nisaea sediminum]|uniref:response regulator n=1 Tax=Nisaea sediminum TaxID=2775867 RepID=UPI001D024ED5|nr:response regulator [Nisaea sediminum]